MSIQNVLFFLVFLSPFFATGQQLRTKSDRMAQELAESIELLEAGLDLDAGLKLYQSTFNTLFPTNKNWQRPLAETEELNRGFEKRRLELLQAFYSIKKQVDSLGNDEKKLDASISKPFKNNKKLLENLKREEQQATEVFKEKMDALLWSLRLEADQDQESGTAKKQQKETEPPPAAIKKAPAKTPIIQDENPPQFSSKAQAANQELLDKYAAQVKKQRATINKLMAMNNRLITNQKKAAALRKTLASNQRNFDSLQNDKEQAREPILASPENELPHFQLFFLISLALLGFLVVYLMLRRRGGKPQPTIDMPSYVDTIVKEQQAKSVFSASKIEIKKDIDQLHLLGENPTILGILLEELVANAFQYAFKGVAKPSLWISLRRVEAKQIRLIVEDNGVGMPPGFDLARSKGMGLQMVQKFIVERLNGQLDIFSSPSEGTQFVLTFEG